MSKGAYARGAGNGRSTTTPLFLQPQFLLWFFMKTRAVRANDKLCPKVCHSRFRGFRPREGAKTGVFAGAPSGTKRTTPKGPKGTPKGPKAFNNVA